jgi:hypothetical protein
MFVGYGVIVILTSLGFNGVLGGRPLYGGSPLILGAGMLVAVIAGGFGCARQRRKALQRALRSGERDVAQ